MFPPASRVEVTTTGGRKSAGHFSIRDFGQLIAEIETAFRTKSSLIELRASARAPIEQLEMEAIREWDSVDGSRRPEIVRTIQDLEHALQARAFYRDARLGATEAKTVQDGLVLRLRALLHHLDPDHQRPPDDF
jgi:hypothetical protein